MYVAFLRGINVSGKNKIPMGQLKDMMYDIGCREVKTYLNTGNVIYDKKFSEFELEQKIKETFDLDIKVIIKSVDEIRAIVESYHLSDGLKNAYVTLFKAPVGDVMAFIDAVKKDDDQYDIHENYLNLYVPSGYGKSKLTNNYLERKTKEVATTRNIKTMRKILELSFTSK